MKFKQRRELYGASLNEKNKTIQAIWYDMKAIRTITSTEFDMDRSILGVHLVLVLIILKKKCG